MPLVKCSLKGKQNMKLVFRFCVSIMLVSVVGICDAANAATAFCYFNTNDGSYLNAEVAGEIADRVQSSLRDHDEIQWVSRPEILKVISKLAAFSGGASDEPVPLQLARWLKADMLVKGTFSLRTGGTWNLQIEIIELKHADVLTRFQLPIVDQSEVRLLLTPRLVDQIAEQVRLQLPEAISKRDLMPKQVLIAPLHFQNVGQSARLDFLERELQADFSEQNSRQDQIRYLQFHESENAIADSLFADSDRVKSNARPRSADHYIWGQYSEIESSGVPFDQVKVQFTLSHWNGGRSRNQKRFEGTVGTKERLLQDIVTYVKLTSKGQHRDKVNDNIREQVAGSFYDRAVALQRDTISPEYKDASHLADGWLRTWREAKRLLSVAVFFDPTNEIIRREFLIEHVRVDIPPRIASNVSKLRGLWNRHRLWSEYSKSFDLDHKLPSLHRFEGQVGGMADNRLLFNDFSVAQMEATRELLTFFAVALDGKKVPITFGDGADGNSTDALPSLLKKWQASLVEQFLSQLSTIKRDRPELLERPASRLIEDMDVLPTLKAKTEMLDAVWPIAAKTPRFRSEEYKADILQMYFEVGRHQDAVEMLAAADASAMTADVPKRPARRPQVAKPAIVVRPLAKISTAIMKPYSIKRWWHVHQVTALTHAGDRLWFAFEGQRMDATLTAGHGLFSRDTRTGKWQTWQGLNRLKCQVNSMLEVDGDLWVAFSGDAICRMNLQSGRARRYRPELGSPTQDVFDLARVGDTLFVGGGDDDQGVLGAFDLVRQQWVQFELPTTQMKGEKLPCPRVKQIAADVNHVAVFANFFGINTQIFVYDRSDMTTMTDVIDVIDAGQIIAKSHPQFSHFTSSWRPNVHRMMWIDDLLWLATSRGLLVFDPTQQKVVHTEAVDYELTSMIRSGNQLWFGACPFRGNGTLGVTGKQTSLLCYDLNARAWETQLPVPHEGYLTKMHLHEDTLWIAPGKNDATIVEVDVTSLADDSGGQ